MENVNSLLSHDQQVVLVTLYNAGVRGLAFQHDSFALYGENYLFMGTLKFYENSPYNFYFLNVYMENAGVASLKSMIENLCPEYTYVL